jgi:cell division protease FtsH
MLTSRGLTGPAGIAGTPRKRNDGSVKSPTGPRPLRRRAVFWVALCLPAILILYIGILIYMLPREGGEEVSLVRFYEMGQSGQIDSAVVLNHDARVLFVGDDKRYWVELPSSAEYMDRFINDALERKLPLDIDQQEAKLLVEPLTYIVPALLIVCAFLLFFLLMRSGSSPFLKAAARRGKTDRPVTFADVAGIDDAVAEIREVRDYLLKPKRFAEIGAEAPRGILLFGPPGTGKTLLARAVAGEAGVPFFSISGTDFVEMYVGVGAARVRDLFRQVRERAPAILFIDELDAVGRTRAGGATAGQDERDQTLNQLLVELDGFDRGSGVVLIGATNRPDVLDPALLRRGRFDRQIAVDRPDRRGRLAILKVHVQGKRLDPSVDLGRLAAQTAGFTGADLANVLNEAALLAARRGAPRITESELEQAIDRTVAGSEGQARLLSTEEKRAVAFHEAGHAIMTWALPHGRPATRVSIVGRATALGITLRVATEDKFVVALDELEDELAVMMGGRASEELVLGQPMSSSKDDLRQATRLARRMVCELGMSPALGRRALGQPVTGPFLGDEKLEPDYSSDVASEIDREIGRLLDEAFRRATDVLVRNRSTLEELAAALVERESLREADLALLVDKVASVSGVVSREPAPAEA